MLPTLAAAVVPLALATCSLLAQAAAPAPTPKPVLRVFLLAGQSNMEGHGVVDLDDERDYNGGKGTLKHFLDANKADGQWAGLRDEAGKWAVRDDVFVSYLPANGAKKAGALTVGFAVYDDAHHFGPELGIGQQRGERFREPVLLIKTAWGGKSLARDFRPPSAEGDTGPFYLRMQNEYHLAIAAIAKDFPALAQHQPKLDGVLWFQGWNDGCDDAMAKEYGQNLVHLIADLRREFGDSTLPFVCGETGNHGSEALRSGQKQGCEDARVAVGARFVPTRAFLKKPEECPNQSHGHHWFGSGESYLRIGMALGAAMGELVAARDEANAPPAATEAARTKG